MEINMQIMADNTASMALLTEFQIVMIEAQL